MGYSSTAAAGPFPLWQDRLERSKMQLLTARLTSLYSSHMVGKYTLAIENEGEPVSGRYHVFAAFIVSIVLLVPALVSQAAVSTNADFDRTWARTDKPVADGQVSPTWMWGPQPFTEPVTEPYAECPGGSRTVQYFDKSRMEITDPAGDPTSVWFVTNGLLSTELITGNLQLGNDTFEQRTPAAINVAGDADDTNGPTYATFTNLLDAAPAAIGEAYIEWLDRAGTITQDSGLAARGITAAYLDDVTNHAIAALFWAFMTSTGTVYQDGGHSRAAV